MALQKRSSFLEERIRKNNENKVLQARIGLYGIAIISIITGLYQISTFTVAYVPEALPVIIIIMIISSAYLGVAIFSHFKPRLSFIIGFVLLCIGLLLSILSFNIFRLLILTVISIVVFNGIEPARSLERSQPKTTGPDDILDSGI